jgi:cleavage and polyadenylation specificity factor subunit 1
LLLGSNELVHIDQSGKPKGVAVNPLTRECTSFSLADQSDLNLRLEGCQIEILSPDNGDLLLVLNDGRLALVSFQIDGRTVSGLAVKLVPKESGGCIICSSISTLSRVGRSNMFAGSEDGDSLVIGWTRNQGQTSRRKSRIQENLDIDLDDEDLEDDEDEDDLYGAESAVASASVAAENKAKTGELIFRIHDKLLNIAPIQGLTYGKPASFPDGEEEKNSADVRGDLELVCAVGRGKGGAIAVMNRQVNPMVIGRFEFPEARGLWTMCAKKPIPKSLQGDKGGSTVGQDYDTSAQYDKFMIVAKVDLDGYETSDVYALTSAGFETLAGTEFEPAAGFTIEAGTMGKDMRIIQVLKSEVRCYDGGMCSLLSLLNTKARQLISISRPDLGLSQILPMLDEETGAEPRAVSASIADPYILLIRDDSSAFVAQIDSSSELEEVEKQDMALLSTKWLTGCLYTDTKGIFADAQPDKGATNPAEAIIMFLLSASGIFFVSSPHCL